MDSELPPLEQRVARARAREALWRKNNPDRNKSHKLKCRYGITLQEYNSLLAGQGGVCAICRGAPVWKGKGFHVDHDHSTGRVRGILCSNCNVLLGHAKESIERLERAVEYLRGTLQ